MIFEDWVEDVDDVVYAYFGDTVYELQQRFNLDLEYYFENDFDPEVIVSEIQDFIEEEEYGSS